MPSELQEIRLPAVRVRELVSVLIRRRWLVACVAGAGVVTVVTLIFLRPPSYRAHAALLIRTNVAQEPVSADYETTAVVPERRLEATVNSTVAILQSSMLMRGAISRLPASIGETDPEGTRAVVAAAQELMGWPSYLYRKLHGLEPTGRVDDLVSEFRRNLNVEPIDQSDLIKITYEDDNPDRAAAIVNALVDTYIDWAAGLNERRGSLEFFEEQRELLKQRLRWSKANLREFHVRESISFASEDEEELRTVRAELSAERARVSTELSGILARRGNLEREVEQLPQRLQLRLKADQSDSLELLKARAMGLEIERESLLGRYTPQSVRIVEIDKQVEAAQQYLGREEEDLVRSLLATDPAVHQVKLQLVEARTREAELTARLGALEHEIAEYTRKLDDLDSLEAERQWHETDLQLEQDAYLAYVRKVEESRFASALAHDDSRIVDVVVAQHARVPTEPEPTYALLAIVAGVIMSLGGGLGAGLVRERLDPLVASVADVQALTGAAILTAIPYDEPGLAGLTSAHRVRVSMRYRGLIALALVVASGLAIMFVTQGGGHPAGPDESATAAAPVAVAGLGAIRASSTFAESPAADGAAVGSRARRARVPARHADPRVGPRDSAVPGGPVSGVVVPLVLTDVAVVDLAAKPTPGLGEVPSVNVVSVMSPSAPGVEATVALDDAERSPGVVPDDEPALGPTVRYRLITVEPGATLFSLIRSTYGQYSPELMDQIRRLNPSITDVERIHVGEILRFPLAEGS